MRRASIDDVTPPPASRDWALWPLRLFLGATFAFAGLQKLANPAYLDAHSPTSVQSTILSLQKSSPIGWLLGISSHAPVLVGVLIALGELAVGLATLLGLWVRIAAAGGLLLALTFFLTVSFHTRPYYYGSDIVFVFAWTVPLLAGAWPEPTLDGWIRRTARASTDPQRRALVLGGAGATGLAVFGGVLAAVTAGLGRAFHQSSGAESSGAGASDSIGTAPSTPAAAPTHGSATKSAPGKQIVPASRMSPGEALQFTDGNGNPAWLVREVNGDFRAFSAVCTHAGCTVGISSGEFVCPCHGGSYSVKTGQVLGGPPPAPLQQLNVRVIDGNVRLV